jgi:Flp pilus assembly protein TadD
MLSACTRILGRIIGRPSDELLTELARKDRPGPAIETDSPILKASGHIQRGQAAFDSEHYAEALHCFSEAIRLAPEAPWAWHGRGDALQLVGQYDGALKAYERACELAPNTGLHHAGRANSLNSIGRIKEADKAWESALKLDSELLWMREGSKKR